jgi:2-aminoadipate transaminase
MSKARLEPLFAERLRPLQASAIREICKLIARPEVKSLAGGWPDPDTFPVADVKAITADLLDRLPGLLLQYGTTEGLTDLRVYIAEILAPAEGIHVTPDEVTLVHGSQQGMDLATAVFLNPGDVALVGLPTYFGGTGACCVCGAELVGVPVDDRGLDVEALEVRIRETRAAGKRPKLVYVIPNFQNPDGSTLPVERRRRIVELAEEHDLIVMEDDPYGALRYQGDDLPSLKSFDGTGRVILLRSFSKTVSAGIRLAWVAAHPEASRKMVVLKQYRDSCTNTVAQYLVHEFFRRGLWDAQIQRVRSHYRRKRDLTLDLLKNHFPAEVTWNRPEGGFFVWVTLPDWLDGEEILRASLDRNVAFVAGRPFFFDRSGGNTIRLSYSQSPDDTIEIAVRTLGEVIRGRLAAKRKSEPPGRNA